MAEKVFIQANEAIGLGAVTAGCEFFAGYPITPQNEITEWFAKEMPKRGLTFVQSEAEFASINILMGAAATGVRSMTSTSSPGFALMQETLSTLSRNGTPCVVVNVSRGSSVRHGQGEYSASVRGNATTGMKKFVLAPYSAQECFDFMQMAFYLADKHRSPVVVLSDGVVGRLTEAIEVKTLEFGPLPPKNWALRPPAEKEISRDASIVRASDYTAGYEEMAKKIKVMEQEVRWDDHKSHGAELLVVAYGYPARVAKEAVNWARAEGIKAGLIRPITLWPFPYDIIRQRVKEGAKKVLVVEDGLPQMIEDVELAVEDGATIQFLGVEARHLRSDGGMIAPDKVLAKIKEVARS